MSANASREALWAANCSGVVVDGDAADIGGGLVNGQSRLPLEDLEDLQGFGHDLGSDAVAGEDGDLLTGAHARKPSRSRAV